MQDRTYIITGSTRGIGKAIGLKLAAHGANIVVVGKSVNEDTRLGGTIFSAAAEIEGAGGKALPVQCDIRFEEQIERVVFNAMERFGRIDGVVNNASAISLNGTANTTAKIYDLMQAVNVRGSFLMVQHCLPYLQASDCAHILTLSPPVSLTQDWLSSHLAYTISKYNMSMLTMGWAAEFKQLKIAANSLWPRTTIDTAAVRNILGGENLAKHSRSTEIMADAAFYILSSQPESNTGNWYIDEDVLAANGVTDFRKYAVVPEESLQKDLFI